MDKIINANHHLHQLSKETPPVFIDKLMRSLDEKIKPLMNSEKTHREIWDNARKWQKNRILILKEHKKLVITTQLDILSSLPDFNWKPLFKIPIKWAQYNFGLRLYPKCLKTRKRPWRRGL